MKFVFSILFVIGYIALILEGVTKIGPHWAPIFNSVVTALFVCLYLLISHGIAWFALTVVVFFTVIFPIAVLFAICYLLFAIGWGTYPSIFVQAKTMLSAFSYNSQLWGLEIFFPFIIGWLVTLAISKFASKPRAN